MRGRNGLTIEKLPIDRVVEILKNHKIVETE
jgi:hypothetical protein